MLCVAVVVKQGESADSVFFIKEGRCVVMQSIVVQDSKNTTNRLVDLPVSPAHSSSTKRMATNVGLGRLGSTKRAECNTVVDQKNSVNVMLATLGPRQIFGDLEVYEGTLAPITAVFSRRRVSRHQVLVPPLHLCICTISLSISLKWLSHQIFIFCMWWWWWW